MTLGLTQRDIYNRCTHSEGSEPSSANSVDRPASATKQLIELPHD